MSGKEMDHETEDSGEMLHQKTGQEGKEEIQNELSRLVAGCHTSEANIL